MVNLPGSAGSLHQSDAGTSPVSTASRLTLPNARNGTARTPLQFYLLNVFPFQPATHSQYNAQKPKVSVRWQPLDPKYIGAYLAWELHRSVSRSDPIGDFTRFLAGTSAAARDPLTNDFYPFEVRIVGNPNLQPGVAYEWSYGTVYSPKWIKGLTLSADWWHIDMRSIASLLGTQFIIENDIPGSGFPRAPRE